MGEGGVGRLSGFPFFHIAGIFFNANCVYLGWPQILIPNPRDTDHNCAEIRKYKPDLLVNVPSLYQMLIANQKFKTLDHSHLKFCISAAAPFPKEWQKALEQVVGERKLLKVYGMTETSPLTTMNPSKGRKKLGPIGLPLLNTDILLADPVTGEEVPRGKRSRMSWFSIPPSRTWPWSASPIRIDPARRCRRPLSPLRSDMPVQPMKRP